MNTALITHPFLCRVGQLPTLWRMLLALAAGAVAAWCGPGYLLKVSRAVLAWDGFAVTALLLLWAAIFTADTDRIRAVAATSDLSRALGFVFVLVGAGASLLSVVALLSQMHGMGPLATARHVGLSIVAVAAAWMMIHTVFTLRYAHLYYDADADGNDRGGLDFPGGLREPDYLDFAYYSFVIGMTAQTADISISGRDQRRLALLHGLIAFFFNAALVALVISGVGGAL